MADIAIKMGVNAPQKDVDGVLRVFDYVFRQDPATDDKPFRFGAYEEDFSDGAIGVLASMSVIMNYTGKDGLEKTYVEHIMQGFERTIEDGKPAFSVIIPPLGRKLIRVIYEQRDREENEEERGRYVQQKAEEFGLV